MTTISANWQAVKERIAQAEARAHRPVGSVALLAVSKTWPSSSVREAAAAGQREFGENYLQEAQAKMAELADLNLVWHFIGPLQSNKTTAIARLFDWVHGVDRLKIAQRLSAARGEAGLPPLQVCLQVNVSGEASKSGVSPEAVPELAAAVAQLPHVTLRGLMAIPEPDLDEADARERFAQVRMLLETLNQQGLTLDTLSMGMSDDLEAAILEGATLVRIGTAIFGYRPRKPADAA